MRFPLLFLAGTAVTVLAQSPAFEVASIKPLQGFVNAGVNLSGPRVTMSGYGLEGLVMDVYQVASWQISGGPVWLGTDPFEIIAKAPGDASPTPEQLRLMLQTLLEERFKLKVHREIKEGSVYALVVAKNGPKMKRSTATDAFFSVGGPLQVVKLTVQKRDMEFFVHQLPANAALGRPVLDKTGLKGDWDFELTFMPGTPPPDSNVPDLFTALQEELGLKLESQRGPVERLIIDHAEKPSPN